MSGFDEMQLLWQIERLEAQLSEARVRNEKLAQALKTAEAEIERLAAALRTAR